MHLSVCLSKQKSGAETSNLVQTWHWTRVTKREQRSKVKVTGKENVQIVFCGFTSNENQNDVRPILHMSSNTFHQRKCSFFHLTVCLFVSTKVGATTAKVV